MRRFSFYYAFAVAFAAAGLFVEDIDDGEVTFWGVILLALVVFLVAIGVGFSSKRI